MPTPTTAPLVAVRDELRQHVANLADQQPWEHKAMFERLLDALNTHVPDHQAASTADLISRVDPTIAVDRALNAEDRIRFMARLVGPWQGAQPADYLDEANNADAHAAAVDDWFAGLNKDSGKFLPAQLAAAYGIPEVLASGLLNTAVVACIVLDRLDRAGGAQAPVELAGRAALYVRGIADALGVQPPEPAGPDDQLDSLI
jgi:hypothetical protein